MTEAMLQHIADGRRQGLPAALATIVATRGSTPCKTGTRMLVLADGGIKGTIGGGCAEAQVRLQALTVLDQRQPCLTTVSLLPDEAAEEGMACGGTMEVFIQPV